MRRWRPAPARWRTGCAASASGAATGCCSCSATWCRCGRSCSRRSSSARSIIPASTLLQPADLADRVSRGDVRHVVAEAAQVPKFADVPGDWTRVIVGAPVAGDSAAGWHRYADAGDAAGEFAPDGVTQAADPLLLYFTSGTTSQPKLVGHTHASYPVGHLSTMYWIGIEPGDVHLNISSPGWAKHAWSNLFAPWNAQATILILNQSRFNAAGLLKALGDCGVTTFCAPPTVWRMLIQADLAPRTSACCANASAAGEPLNPEVIEQVRKAWGITVRDGFGQTETTAQIGNTARPAGEAGLDGPAAARLPGHARRPGEWPARQGRGDLPGPQRAAARADDRLPRRRRARRRRHARRLLPHRRRRDLRRRRLHHVRRAHGRRVQGLGLPDLAVRAGKRADRARGGRRGGGRALPRPDQARGAQGLRTARRGRRARP